MAELHSWLGEQRSKLARGNEVARAIDYLLKRSARTAEYPSIVLTIARVARMLGEDEEKLEEIAMQIDPEDGCLSVMDLDDDVSTTAFTAFGVENLKDLLADWRTNDAAKQHRSRITRSMPRCLADGYHVTDGYPPAARRCRSPSPVRRPITSPVSRRSPAAR